LIKRSCVGTRSKALRCEPQTNHSMPTTQRRRAALLFRKLKFCASSSSTNVDESHLEIDKMMLHSLDCLGALQCIMGNYDTARAKVFWGAVETIAEIGIDAARGQTDRRHPGATSLLRAFPNELKASDGRSWLPLHWASVTDNVEVEDVLKIARADPMATTQGCNQPISANPGHLICAVRDPNMEVVQCLFNFYPRMASSKDQSGDLPIHYAARYSGSTDLMHYLLQANPGSTKIKGEGNLVPLHCGLFNESNNRVAIVKTLLQADPSAASMINSDGDTALHTASVQECEAELVHCLVSVSPESAKFQNDIGQLPLHTACGSKKTLNIVRILLKAHPEGTRVFCLRGCLPAHTAAEHGCSTVLEEILKSYPDAVNIGCTEDADNTPLIKAVASVNEDTVNFMCENYPTAVSLVNVEGKNAMHFAAEGDSLSLLTTICKASPDIIRCQDLEGKLPLHIFCEMHHDPIHEMEAEADCLRYLIKMYPDGVKIADKSGMTPLQHAVPENIFMRRQLLTMDPSQSIEEMRTLNYEAKRQGIFLAFAAINAYGIPNIFCNLRTRDQHLLQYALSYL
jgi:ankyrin repeat protein